MRASFSRSGLLDSRMALAPALALILLLAGCQYVPVQPHPLVGEGPPPGYISGNIPEAYKGLKNPYTPSDTLAIGIGAGLYLSFEPACENCHGVTGRGDGPLWPYLEPTPNDFAAPLMLRAFRDYPDYVFWWVSEGVPKTVMPAWQDRMTETQRWQVITYAWHLGEQAAPPPPSVASSGEEKDVLRAPGFRR